MQSNIPQDTPSRTTKVCTKCKSERDISQFSRNKRAKDGLHCHCKRCQSRHPQAYDQKIANHSKGLLKCSTCQQWKDRSEFSQYKNGQDGYCYECKRCKSKDPVHYDDMRANTQMGLRRCCTCQQWKEPGAFYNNRAVADGLTRECRVCLDRRTREYERRNREKVRAHKQLYAQRHGAEMKAYRRWHYVMYWDRYQARGRAWRAKNPARFRAIQERRRGRALNGSYTRQQWDALIAFYDHQCLCCGRREPDIQLTPDHIMPLAKDGSNTIENLQPLCATCNKQKYTAIVDYRTTLPDFHTLGLPTPHAPPPEPQVSG